MRIFTISFVSGLILIGAASGFAADDTTTPTPPNQNDVKVDKSESKAGVTGVQSQSAGPHTGSGSLDPSQQSSMGLGISIPFHKEKETPPAADTKPADGDSSK